MEREELLRRLARAGSVATRAFESVTPNSKSVASLRLLGVAVRNFYDQGFTEFDLMQVGHRVQKAMERETLGDER